MPRVGGACLEVTFKTVFINLGTANTILTSYLFISILLPMAGNGGLVVGHAGHVISRYCVIVNIVHLYHDMKR